MRYTDWLDVKFSQARVNAFLVGSFVGVAFAMFLAATMAWVVERINYRSDEQRISAIRAEYAKEAEECKAIVRRLSSEEYETVLALARQVPPGRR